MSSKIKSALHLIVNLGGNIILMDIVPPEYKGYAILAFNLAQVLYAYFDPTYSLQKYGRSK